MRQIVFENGAAWCKKNGINKKTLKLILLKIAHDTEFHVKRMSYVIVTDQEIRTINNQYLKHDYYTDIITFDLKNMDKHIHGEAYISKDSIEHNASLYQTTIANEFARVVIHGFLHLVGFDDKTSEGQKIMRSKEDLYLSSLTELETNT